MKDGDPVQVHRAESNGQPLHVLGAYWDGGCIKLFVDKERHEAFLRQQERRRRREQDESEPLLVLCDYCDQPADWYTTQGERGSRRFACSNEEHRQVARAGRRPLGDRERRMDLDIDLVWARMRSWWRAHPEEVQSAEAAK